MLSILSKKSSYRGWVASFNKCVLRACMGMFYKECVEKGYISAPSQYRPTPPQQQITRYTQKWAFFSHWGYLFLKSHSDSSNSSTPNSRLGPLILFPLIPLHQSSLAVWLPSSQEVACLAPCSLSLSNSIASKIYFGGSCYLALWNLSLHNADCSRQVWSLNAHWQLAYFKSRLSVLLPNPIKLLFSM